MNKSCKFEIYPNKEQIDLINKTIGCCRYVWNWALDKKKIKDKSISFGQISKDLTLIKKEIQWLNEPNAQALIAELRNLESAYKRFFANCKKKIKGKKGFPKFKKRGSKESFSNQQDVKVNQNRIENIENGFGLLIIPKIKNIKIRLHREVIGKIGTVTISKTPSGRFYASITATTEDEFPKKKKIIRKTTVGIDRGLKNLAVLSDGNSIDNPKFFSKIINRLAVLDRRICKKRERNKNYKESKKYKELLKKAAVLFEKLAFRRNDYLHKNTKKIVTDWDTVGLETLNVKGMMKNRKLSKSIGDVSWYEFERQLSYKSDWYGKNFHKINRWFASSQTCSKCGFVNKELKLQDREWTCKCGIKHDRDVNAAINIKELTLKELKSNSGSSGSTINKATSMLNS